MIVTEKVLIEVNNKNLKIFRKKFGSDIEIGLNEISVRDLSKGSHFKLEVKCDSCGVIKTIEWRAYLKFTKDESEIYCCQKCNNVKVRKTNLEKYGVVCNSQLESNKEMVRKKWENKTDEERNIISAITKETNNIKYGYSYYSQTEEFKNRFREACLDKYGVTNPSYSDDIKMKRVETKLKKFGKVNNSQTTEWRDAMKQSWENKSEVEVKKIVNSRHNTTIERYGFSSYSQTDEFKEKYKETCRSKYGYDSHNQSPLIHKKQQESGFKSEQFLDTGLNYQGTYELHFLEKFYEKITIDKTIPIRYELNEKIHFYHPDFYLPEYNLIVEIKSKYTYDSELDKNLAKKEYSIKSGYNFIFIIDKNYEELIQMLDRKC